MRRTIISNVKSNGIAAFDAEAEDASKQDTIDVKPNTGLSTQIGGLNSEILG